MELSSDSSLGDGHLGSDAILAHSSEAHCLLPGERGTHGETDESASELQYEVMN